MSNESPDAAPMRSLFEPDEVREVLRDMFYRTGSRTDDDAADATPAGGAVGGEETPDRAGSPGARRANPGPRKDRQRKRRRRPAKADHYEVICISMYKEDLAKLDARVADLKAAGHRKMSRSALIRFALATVDVDDLPRPI